MANLFIKMLEKFCQGTVFVQTKSKQRSKKTTKKKTTAAAEKRRSRNGEMSEIDKVRDESVEECCIGGLTGRAHLVMREMWSLKLSFPAFNGLDLIYPPTSTSFDWSAKRRPRRTFFLSFRCKFMKSPRMVFLFTPQLSCSAIHQIASELNNGTCVPWL